MDQRGFIKVLLVVLVTLVIGVAGYFIINNESGQGESRGGGGVRAGLDFRVEVTDHGMKKIVNCDICNYSFSDDDTYFQTRDVHAKEGYVEMIFLKKLKKNNYNPTYNEPKIDYQDIFVTNEQHFNIGYHKVFRIKIGQTVSLQDVDITVRVLDVAGLGCPLGTQC